MALEGTVTNDKQSAWLQKLDEDCPYQVALPRRQLMDDSAIMDFLLLYVGKFDLYVEDRCPINVDAIIRPAAASLLELVVYPRAGDVAVEVSARGSPRWANRWRFGTFLSVGSC